MAKTKYHFDVHTLTFKKVRISLKQRVLKVLSLMTSSMVFSAVTLVIIYTFVDSPKERVLKREIKQYEQQYKILNDRMNQLNTVLADLQNRDDDVYRRVLEAEPISKDIRNAGYGGSDRYEALQGFDNSELITATMKKMDLLSRRIYVQSKSYDDIFELAKKKSDMLSSIPAILPISKKKGQLISGFGYRIHPIFKSYRMHTGVDFAAPKGTPVYAAGNGVVYTEKGASGYGILVSINHGYGYASHYAHLSRMVVRNGQRIKRGDIVGYVGSTGLSTAPHLHYEIEKNGEKINPVNFFYNDLSPEEYNIMIEESSKVNQSLS